MTYIAIDEHNVEGKKLVAFLKTQSYIEILEYPISLVKEKKMRQKGELVKPGKRKPVQSSKQKFLNGFMEAIEELNQVKAGKIKGIPAKELLNEL